MYECMCTGVYIDECTCLYADAHTHTHTHTTQSTCMKTFAEAKGFHGQLFLKGHSHTQILEVKRITPYQYYLYYKSYKPRPP